MKNLIISKI